MSEELKRLLELSRANVMTNEEYEEQRISFAYGNTHFENESITRDSVEQAARNLRDSANA